MNSFSIDLKKLKSFNHVKINNLKSIPSFSKMLDENGLYPLKSASTDILQINMGYMCNQTCTHCHVDAGPTRKEIMTRETFTECLKAIDYNAFKTVDLTGGAPEMNPEFEWFINELYKRNVEIIVRSNLTILVSNDKYGRFPQLFKEKKVQIISSLPCYTKQNVDKQRGNGVFEKSLKALKILNQLGYGKKDSGLELNLVYNPGGAFLPSSQHELEMEYKMMLKRDYEIVFNKLYTITNLPINRFLDYLLLTNKYEKYMMTLANSFNPSAAMGVMCKNTISVGWDGTLYDCDFNQMLNLPAENKINHISQLSLNKIKYRDIVTRMHCYGCTAGEGSSCQGAIVN